MTPRALFASSRCAIRLYALKDETRLRASPKPRFYLPPQLHHLRRLHPILRQHEQLTLLGPDMAFEQDAETVDLVVRAGLVTELHLTWN